MLLFSRACWGGFGRVAVAERCAALTSSTAAYVTRIRPRLSSPPTAFVFGRAFKSSPTLHSAHPSRVVPAIPPWVPCSGSISHVLGTVCRSAPTASRYLSTSPANPMMRVWAMRAGHAAFIMLASMYLMTDMVLLRVLGIIANALDMFYCFLVAETPLWLNIRWGAFYVLVNVVQLAQLYYENRSIAMSPEQLEVFETYFRRHGITPVQFTKFYRLATERTFAPHGVLTQEQQPASQLFLIIDGKVEVYKDEQHLSNLPDGAYLGELEYMQGFDNYQASAKAHVPTKVLQWQMADLKQLCTRNPSMEFALRSMLTDGLGQTAKRSLEFSRLAAYQSVLLGVLADGVVATGERQFIERYRTRHRIVDVEHQQALTSLGWTVDQYNAGERG